MILVADQNRSTAELLVRRLRTDGLAADAASTCGAMVKRVDAGGVSAIVLDPSLPGGPLEALAALRSRPIGATLPVIVFGTSDRAADAAAAKAAGATAFLVKGRVSPKKLVEEIRALLSTGNAASAMIGGTAAAPASSEKGAYYIKIEGLSGDALRLSEDLGCAPGMRCEDCRAPLSLYLQRDFSRWGKWLFGTFGCLACAAKQREIPIVRGAVSMGGVA